MDFSSKYVIVFGGTKLDDSSFFSGTNSSSLDFDDGLEISLKSMKSFIKKIKKKKFEISFYC